MNKIIRRKLIEVEQFPRSIEQQYKRATNLNRHQRERRKEKKRLRGRGRGETGNLVLRLIITKNAKEINKQ